jgi:hypothetical protein
MDIPPEKAIDFLMYVSSKAPEVIKLWQAGLADTIPAAQWQALELAAVEELERRVDASMPRPDEPPASA